MALNIYFHAQKNDKKSDPAGANAKKSLVELYFMEKGIVVEKTWVTLALQCSQYCWTRIAGGWDIFMYVNTAVSSSVIIQYFGVFSCFLRNSGGEGAGS